MLSTPSFYKEPSVASELQGGWVSRFRNSVGLRRATKEPKGTYEGLHRLYDGCGVVLDEAVRKAKTLRGIWGPDCKDCGFLVGSRAERSTRIFQLAEVRRS